MNAQFCKWLVSFAVLFCLIIVSSTATAVKPDKTGKPPKDDPQEPVASQPAFAYYCKANPNSGAVCLANADGSMPLKIFSTTKFQGDTFNISAYQEGLGGKVLVIDVGDLWQIDYQVDEEGFLSLVDNPVMVFDSEVSGNLSDVDWSPSGDDFAFHDIESIYLNSRANHASGQFGAPIITSITPHGADDELLMWLSWGTDDETLYFIKWYITDDGPWWYEFHKADISGLGVDETQTASQCILASREVPHEQCLIVDSDLQRMLSLSIGENDRWMVSGYGLYSVGDQPEELYYTNVGSEASLDLKIPEFIGTDWTSKNTIIGETYDDEVLEFDPSNDDIKILIRRGATSPDWNN